MSTLTYAEARARRGATWQESGEWHRVCACGFSGTNAQVNEHVATFHRQYPVVRRERPAPVWVEPTPCPEGCRCPDCGPTITGMPDEAWKAEMR